MSEKKKDESKVKKEQELIKLLKSGARSYKFLEQKFGLIEEQIGDILDKAVGYVPFTMRNQYNEMVITLVKKPGKIIERPKDFIIRKAEKTPYLQINIPHKERHKIDIILLADLHYGSNACDIKTLQRWIKWMEKQDDTYIILLGDLIEMAHKSSVGAGVYEQMNPQAQAVGVVELLQPIKDKILLSVNGNHEKRSYVALGFDVGYFIAERLGVPYYTEPAHLDITFADYTFTFFCWHGRSNAMTEGGKLNAALFPLSFTEFIHFYCSG